jgi:catechol 2,3-dioxygenase-like lactoylglutathione lyase family enzyme
VRSPGIHHTGMTVSDLERSIEFYELFGYEVKARIEEEGDEVDRGTGVDGAHLDVAILERGPARLELIQYVSPEDGPSPHATNNAVGAAHICLQVDDIDAAVEELSGKGIEFQSEPIYHESGIRWVYCSDPDGITAELLQVLE